MALELGKDFPARWLAAAAPFRQRVIDELNAICQLLEPQTSVSDWQAADTARGTWPSPYATQDESNPADGSGDGNNSSHDRSNDNSSDTTALRPPLNALATLPDGQIAAELKKRFLREADDVIEQALEPIRQQLRDWLYAEMQTVLRDLNQTH